MSDDKLTLADDAAGICEDVTARYFQPESRYQHQKVPGLITTIADQVVQRLTQEAKLPRKYIAYVTVMQRNGAGLTSISSCSWNAPSDSCYVYSTHNKAMHCIITVYGVTL